MDALSCRALVVDDEEAVRHLAMNCLQHEGFVCDAAGDGPRWKCLPASPTTWLLSRPECCLGSTAAPSQRSIAASVAIELLVAEEDIAASKAVCCWA